MGLCIINIASFFYIDKQFENIENINYLVKIISAKEEKDYTNKYVVKILKDVNVLNKSNCNIKNTKLIIYTDKDTNFLPGDVINIKGVFSRASSKRNFGGFDYRNYLKQFKIFGIVQVEEFQKITEEKDFMCYLENIRMNLLERIDTLYEKEYAGFLDSLLLGKTDSVSEKIEENFRDSNISHVLAISGMHVSYIIISLRNIFNVIMKNKKIKNYILVCCLIMFSILTGNSVSCIRACIMSSMVCIASNFEKKNNFYFSFIYSLLVILIYNPYNIYNIGLWLSYMGTLGIVLISPFLRKFTAHKFKVKNYKNSCFISRAITNKVVSIITKNKIILKFIKNIFENFLVTISAQILIFPITMYVFNTISFSFFISNILISFFIGPVLIFGYISLFFSYTKIPFFKLLVFIEEFFIEIILKISEICAKLPLSKVYVVTPNFLCIVFYYFIIFFVTYMFYKRRIYMIKLLISNNFIKKELEKIKSYKFCKKRVLNKFNCFCKNFIVIFIVICIVFSSNFWLENRKTLQINFVDVGQGDCTYIKTPNGKNIIIDGGEGNTEKYDYGENVVLPYLLDKKVKKIDYLIVTHADSDHIGGLFSVIENLKIDCIVIGIQPEISEQYLDLLKLSEKRKINIVNVKAGDKIKLEKNIFLVVLWPIKDKLIKENILNNNSLVFKITYNNFSCFFTGDIEEVAEKQILEEYKNLNLLNATVLKVAHHGSKTSSIEKFLDEVKPQIALIGVGNNNKFGHPSEIVLNRLESLKCRIYRTDENGEINIIVDNKGKMKIKTLY